MEPVWWVFKQIYNKSAVYRSYKVMPYSTALVTPLSNFETAQNYKDRQDLANVVASSLLDHREISLLFWTTTPWPLPMILAIAVNPDLEYILIYDKKDDGAQILLKSSFGMLYTEKQARSEACQVSQRYKGSEMLGWQYLPLFSVFQRAVQRLGIPRVD